MRNHFADSGHPTTGLRIQPIFQRVIAAHRILWAIPVSLWIVCAACTMISGVRSSDSPDTDTTSSVFSWQFDSIGTFRSVIHDLSILDNQTFFGVGLIRRDSLIDNLIEWDGVYRLKSIPLTAGFASLKALTAHSRNNLMIASDVTLLRLTSTTVEELASFLPSADAPGFGSINRIWSADPNTLFLVGQNGYTILYQAGEWRALPGSNRPPLLDIHGNGNTIVTVGYSGQNRGLIMSYTGSSWQIVNLPFLPREANPAGVWVSSDSVYCVTQLGLAVFKPERRSGRLIPLAICHPGGSALSAIRGNHARDFMIADSRGGISHYNGRRWRHFDSPLPAALQPHFILTAFDFRDDRVVAGGYHRIHKYALILRGRRTHAEQRQF